MEEYPGRQLPFHGQAECVGLRRGQIRVEGRLNSLTHVEGLELRKTDRVIERKIGVRANVRTETGERRGRLACYVVCVHRDIVTGRKAQCIVQVEGGSKLFPVIVAEDGEAAADNRLACGAEESSQQALLEARRPRRPNTRLEVLIVPRVHRAFSVRRSGKQHVNRLVERHALRRGSNAHVEVLRQRDVWLYLEPTRLVDRTAQSVTQPEREGQDVRELTRVLDIQVAGLSRQGAV